MLLVVWYAYAAPVGLYKWYSPKGNWSRYFHSNFPFSFAQSKGCFAAFLRLHPGQRHCRLLAQFDPPLDRGTMWSTWYFPSPFCISFFLQFAQSPRWRAKIAFTSSTVWDPSAFLLAALLFLAISFAFPRFAALHAIPEAVALSEFFCLHSLASCATRSWLFCRYFSRYKATFSLFLSTHFFPVASFFSLFSS